MYRVEGEADAVRTILKEAGLLGRRLVVMATRGHGGIAGRLLGSGSSKVVRNAKCPVIAVRLPPGVPHERIPMRLKLRRILLPTDLSAVSARAFPIAAAIAGLFHSRLTALHVSQGDGPEKALAKLEKFAASHHRSNVPLSFQVRQGEPAGEILTHALHFNFDLIAMTTQGAHRLRDRLFGSTTERVLRASTRPVLIVK